LPVFQAEDGRGGADRNEPGAGKGLGIESDFDAGGLCFGACGGGGREVVSDDGNVEILA